MSPSNRARFWRKTQARAAGEISTVEASTVDDIGGVADVGEVAQDAADGESAGEWLAYELHEWALEGRVMLRGLLDASEVVHSWQGASLLVHESFEESVDALIDEASAAQQRRLEPDDDFVAFEMAGWPAVLQTELIELLGLAAVLHELDGDGDLIVSESDSEEVERLIDEVLASADEADLDELEGLEANELLSQLFEACDRLRRNPRDAEGVAGAQRSAARLMGVRAPFGFSAVAWRNLRSAAAQLVDLLQAARHRDDGSDGSLELRDGETSDWERADLDQDALRELARRMRDFLHGMI